MFSFPWIGCWAVAGKVESSIHAIFKPHDCAYEISWNAQNCHLFRRFELHVVLDVSPLVTKWHDTFRSIMILLVELMKDDWRTLFLLFVLNGCTLSPHLWPLLWRPIHSSRSLTGMYTRNVRCKYLRRGHQKTIVVPILLWSFGQRHWWYRQRKGCCWRV